MRPTFPIHCVLAIGGLAMACTSPSVGESTIRGTAALSTFPSAPSIVVARDRSGRSQRATVDAQGQFALPLAKGQTYRLSLEGGGSSIPIAFPRVSGRLDATFVVNANGALLRLGQVRHFARVPPGGFHVFALQVPSSAPPQEIGAAGNCVDCVNDDQSVTCGASGSDPESKAQAGADTIDTAEQADPNGELAVADHNVPEELTGCEIDDDNVEQEGEH